MKVMMVIIDGLMDEKMKELGDQNTLEAARHANLDQLAAQGTMGYLNACPEGYLPESMVCILNLLGIGREYYPKSRASIELLAHGIVLQEDEVVLRCNLVGFDHENKLCSFNGGSLATEKMESVSELIKGIDPHIQFFPLSGYRNLMVIKKEHFLTLDCLTYPPHESLGADVNDLLADLYESADRLQRFVVQSSGVIQDSTILYEATRDPRTSDQKPKLNYMYYPWGLAEKATLPSFETRYQMKGAAVCQAEIAKGIALALGMHVPEIEGATADVDTNLRHKAETACTLLKEYDFVLVHINGADEASHRYDYRQKIQFMERIDQEFMGVIHRQLTAMERESRLLICSDHATSPVSGKHGALPVPWIYWNSKQRSAGLRPGIRAEEVLQTLFLLA